MFKGFFGGGEKFSPIKNNSSSDKQFDKKTEAFLENYGLAEIDNPEILRLISAIDLHYLSPEKVDGLMEKIKQSHVSKDDYGSLAKILADRTNNKNLGLNPEPGILYGYMGMNRYQIESSGKVSLMTGANIQPAAGAIEKAKKLGMEIA